MILSCKITFVSSYDVMAVTKVNFRFGEIPPSSEKKWAFLSREIKYSILMQISYLRFYRCVQGKNTI